MAISSTQSTTSLTVTQQNNALPLLSAEEHALVKGIYQVEELTADEIGLIKDLSKWVQTLKSKWSSANWEMATQRILESYKNKTEELHLNSLSLDSASLPYDALSRMTHLKELDLCFNKLSTLDPKLFNNLKKLESLDLGNNKFTDLDPELFKNLHNLRNLSLLNAKLTQPNLVLSAIKNLGKLESLNLYGNQLTKLDPQLFENLGKLEKLDLGGNPLTNLDSQLFENLSNLKELGLSDCHLTQLDSAVFRNLAKLEILNLCRNLLTDLADQLFQGLGNLKNLDLNYNKLTKLNLALFENLVNLEGLDLAVNFSNYQSPPKLDLRLIDRFSKLQRITLFDGRLCFSVTPVLIEQLFSLSKSIRSEIIAIRNYARNDYTNLNKKQVSTDNQQTDSDLRNAITKLGERKNLVKTFRGARYETRFSNKKLDETTEIKWKTSKFLSTSKDPFIAHQFAAADKHGGNGAFMAIFGQSGAHIEQVSHIQNEQEVLYNKGTEFRLLFRHEYSDAEHAENKEKLRHKKFQVSEEVGLPKGTGSTPRLVSALDLAEGSNTNKASNYGFVRQGKTSLTE